MTIAKRILVYIIIIITLLGLYFIYNYFTKPIAIAPIKEPNNSSGAIQPSAGFRDPSGPPSIEGPSGPPPR